MEAPETEIPEVSENTGLCLLPGHLFFIESIELPEALTPEEIPSFAELSLEATAPFPLEQLNWGYICDPAEQRLLYYATHQDRLRQAGFKELESFTWVLPDCIALHGLAHGSKATRLHTPHSHCEFNYGNNSASPEALKVQPAPQDSPGHEDAYQLIAAELDEQNRACFTLTAPDSETTLNNTFDEATLWAADVRPSAFKINERRTRKLSEKLILGFNYALGCVALLLIIEVFLFGCNLWLNTRENKVASQLSSVAKIQEQQALSVKLERVFENQLRPVAVLELINTMRDRSSIHYNETSTDSENHITIEGEAKTVNAFNQFINRLKASDQLELIGAPKTLTRSGETTFSVEFAYTHRETQAPLAPAKPTELETAKPTDPAQPKS
jgi:hypothetical protein